MVFLRFSRDRHGYEHFYLIQPPKGRDQSRGRILYWFRTPPHIKVGREPFDAEVRQTLSAQFPGVEFDWKKIAETPIPRAEPEYWRERRDAARPPHQPPRGDAEIEGMDETADRPDRAGTAPQEVNVGGSPAVVAPRPEAPPTRRRRRRRRGRHGGGTTPSSTPAGDDRNISASGPPSSTDASRSENDGAPSEDSSSNGRDV
jgi:hypothetical protein